MADSPIELPQLGETVSEGTILRWLKDVGDSVDLDEPLYEISTDKVDTEVPSPLQGVLKEIKVKEGETVEVGTVLGVMDASDAAEQSDKPQQPEESADSSAESAPEKSAVAKAAKAPKESASTVKSAPEPTPKQAPAPKPEPAASSTASAGQIGIVTSPLVRRLIHKEGIDISQITPTGPGGRITRADVKRALSAGAGNKAGGASKLAFAPQLRTGPAGEEVIDLSNIRKITAQRMRESKDTSPHVLTAVEVDFENLERVRQKHRPAFKTEEGFSLTYLPFISRAVCDALVEYPRINASISEAQLTVHKFVNLGIAVDLNFEGLLAPVIRDADTKTLRTLAREVVDLANRARTKKLSPQDLEGGTFTITNPGQYGTLMQFPIINQPQVAILSTDGVKRKPVVITTPQGEESISIHSVGVLALAWDHRAFDGAYVAAFLGHLRDIIENRDWESEL